MSELQTHEDLISWQEAEWTRQRLGMKVVDFARMLGVAPIKVTTKKGRAQSFLSEEEAFLLRLGVQNKHVEGTFV